MWQISLPAEQTAAGLPRRSFLQVGATLGGLTAFHAARAQAEVLPTNDKAVILFWMAGGPSHIDMYDMKPRAPVEVRGPFAPISTTLPGFDVCELMPRHVGIAQQLSVIRSLRHTLADHDDASHWVQTGYPLPQARQRGQQQPCQGSVVAKVRGPQQPGVPAYVCIPEDYRSHAGYYQAAAYLGGRYNAVNSGGDKSLGNYRPPEFQLPTDVPTDRLQGRERLLSTIERLQNGVKVTGPVHDLRETQQQALELITGPRSRDLFDVAQESTPLRDRYGRHAYGQAALLARRLVESGVRFVTINLYEKDVDWWDDHYTIEKNLRKRLPLYDQALATLIEDLQERSMLDRVLVVACGEFGRTPRIDQYAGRSHWPRAMSAVLAGGGIRSGQVIGSTTWDGGEPADRALGPGDLLASIYRVLGVDPHLTFPDHLGRPTPLIPEGSPIRQLFSA